MVLEYIRSKHAGIVDQNETALLARSVIEDTYFAAEVEMAISIPGLAITSIRGEMRRVFSEKCLEVNPRLQEVVGLFIGPGILKSVNSLVGGADGCPKMADLVLECCDQVILRFTLDPLRKLATQEGEQWFETQGELLRQNPRLLGSCIAFAEDSPLLKRLGL